MDAAKSIHMTWRAIFFWKKPNLNLDPDSIDSMHTIQVASIFNQMIKLSVAEYHNKTRSTYEIIQQVSTPCHSTP